VSLRRDQLIPVNKAVNEKEQLEKGLEEEEKKKSNTAMWTKITRTGTESSQALPRTATIR
jgi:hypothetical protein